MTICPQWTVGGGSQGAPSILAEWERLHPVHPGCCCILFRAPSQSCHPPAHASRETEAPKSSPRSPDPAPAGLSGSLSLRATQSRLAAPLVSQLSRGQSQFPGSPVEVLTWLWAAVWGQEAGQMSQCPGEEAAPWGGHTAGPLAWLDTPPPPKPGCLSGSGAQPG